MLGTRRVLEQRKSEGLAGGMQFTYRDPVRSTDPGRALPGAKSIVVGAWRYAPGGAPALPGAVTAPPAEVEVAGSGGGRPHGVVARYAQSDHYEKLRKVLGELAALLRGRGWSARVLVDDNALVDRAAAERAGLGWYGKNANILLPGQGSWFVLGSVVTDALLPPGSQVADGCGPCQRCLRSCPTGALIAPGTLDARRCLAWLLQAEGVFPFEYRAALGARIYGCDDCQESCPANRVGMKSPAAPPPGDRAVTRASRGAAAGAWPEPEPAPAPGPSLGTLPLARGPHDGQDATVAVDILDMLHATDDELLGAFGRWYIPRRDPRYLRRNALIVLGNTGDGSSPEVEEVLRRYLSGPDELLCAHAVWAAARLGRVDLLQGFSSDPAGTPASALGLVGRELELASQVEQRRAR